MTQAITKKTDDSGIVTAVFESLALKGDISNLNPQQKVEYMEHLCTSLGLNPLTQPFTPLKLNGKEIFYAGKGCTDQLANVYKLTREIIKTEQIGDVYVATCKASSADGRYDVSTGAVALGNLKGNDLANALMKAETKAKRRATLAFCGLGFLDESELETIPGARPQANGNGRPSPQLQSAPVEGEIVTDDEPQTVAEAIKALNAAGDSVKWDKNSLTGYARDLFGDVDETMTLETLDDEQKQFLLEDLQLRLKQVTEAE